MKVLVVTSLLLAVASAQVVYTPYGWGAPLLAPRVVAPVYTAPAITVPTSSQYHAQDELGQFAFGHRGDNQARDEVKTFDGSVRGAYSYVDPTGKLINVQYLADGNGFRVLGANNLPVAPAVPAPIELKGPEPVMDTPEVIAARANFARSFAEAESGVEKKEEEKKEEDKKERRKRDLLLASPVWSGIHPLVHTPLVHTPLVAPVVPLAKTTIKTAEFKPIEDAKTPAATKKAEILEKETEIVSPWGSLGIPVVPQVATKTIALDKEDKKIFSPLPLIGSPYIYI